MGQSNLSLKMADKTLVKFLLIMRMVIYLLQYHYFRASHIAVQTRKN